MAQLRYMTHVAKVKEIDRLEKAELSSDASSMTYAWICRSSIRGEFRKCSGSSPTTGIRGSLNESESELV